MKGRYELVWDSADLAPIAETQSVRAVPSPAELLAKHARWFCRLRWLVVLFLASYGLLRFLPATCLLIGIRCPGNWPLVVSLILVILNLAFSWDLRRHTSGSRTQLNLWVQIACDLVILTFVVHFTGEFRDIIAFAYLFHIVLACIFFDRRTSLMVLLLALGCYGVLLGLEALGLIPAVSVLISSSPAKAPTLLRIAPPAIFATFAAVVWYLASHLSSMVRQRDEALSELNQTLLIAQEAKQKHLLRTTHELKAPFAAIQANVQLLAKGYAGPLSSEAKDILKRIDDRCKMLANTINEMLQLANLRSAPLEVSAWKILDVAAVLNWCKTQVQPLASERGVQIDAKLQSCPIRGAEEQLRVLFSNLLSNAILYSRPQSRVEVRSFRRADGGARVVIEDHGIGIEAEKLPKIFDEYYRTERAAQFNPSSSGLGLAIVKHIAGTHRVRILVESEPDVGTVFTLDFQPVESGHIA